MGIDLKPCPFCGGEAKLTDIDDGENAGASFISCTRCLASGNLEFGRKENFIQNWNGRPKNSMLDDDASRRAAVESLLQHRKQWRKTPHPSAAEILIAQSDVDLVFKAAKEVMKGGE